MHTSPTLFCFAAAACVQCSTAAVFAQSTDISLKSAVTDVQPMTGIVLWSDNDKAKSDSVTLEYRYCGYNEVVQPDGTYDYTKINAVLDDISSRGHQAVLRFYFVYVGQRTTVPEFVRKQPGYQETVGKSEKKTTHFCDWSHAGLQEFTIDFYTRFANQYDTDSRLAFLQTGFGLWAEYHIYEGPRTMGKTFPSKEFQAKFLKHLDRQFMKLPWSISIDAADYDYSPLEDNQDLLSLKFGAFDDSFLCKPHPKENAANWKTLGSDRWKRAPAGGEFSYYNKRDQKNALSDSGPNGVSFAKSAREFHISYMIGNDQPRYRTMAEIKAASLQTGYRFRVTSAKRDNGVLQLEVTNEGAAPIYRDAWFAAGERRSSESLRGLLPGQTLNCRITDITDADLKSITIQCDDILPTQAIQFAADLP